MWIVKSVDSSEHGFIIEPNPSKLKVLYIGCLFYPNIHPFYSYTEIMTPNLDVALVPWDPESPAHSDRLYQQRIACGWEKELVESWKDLQRQGKKSIFWIVSSFTPSIFVQLSFYTLSDEIKSQQKIHRSSQNQTQESRECYLDILKPGP